MLRTFKLNPALSAVLDGHDQFVAAHAGAHRGATSPWSQHQTPTAAQAKAGNYMMGRVRWQDLDLRIENPVHTVREGKDTDGKTWRNVMKANYGYIAGTRGADGDAIDVFLGPAPESRRAWILNQRNAEGGFDEHKVLVGFADGDAAATAYRTSYSPGWDRGGPPLALSATQLKWWLRYADTTREFTMDLVPPETEMTDQAPLSRVFWDAAAMPRCGLTVAEVMYAIRAHDGVAGLVLDPLTMADIREGAELLVTDALVTEVGRLRPKMVALSRIMEAASASVKPVDFQISEPMRRYGGVHVAVLFEFSDGQTITIWLHNPDSTPNKLTIADELVSWKWVLNKKDITIIVAPEKGTDLNMREAARRVMRLVEKNSAAFAKANTKRVETMAEIDGLRVTLDERKGVLKSLLGQIEVAKEKAEMTPPVPVAVPDPVSLPEPEPEFDPSTMPEGTYVEWEDKIITMIEWRLEETRGDAQGMVEVQEARMKAAFEEQETAEAAYQMIFGHGGSKNALAGDWVVSFEGDTSGGFYFSEKSKAYDWCDQKAESKNELWWVTNIKTGEFRLAFANMTQIMKNDGTAYPASEDDIRPRFEQAQRFANKEVGQAGTDWMLKYLPLLLAWFSGQSLEWSTRYVASQFGAQPEPEPEPQPQPQPQPQPEPAAEAFDLAYLKDVVRGAHDTEPLDDMLTRIQAAVEALNAAGTLTGDVDAAANDAITHWVELDQRANG